MPTSINSPQFVLIDTETETNLDRDVLPAAIEFVVREVISKRLKGNGSPANVCLLSIDRPVSHFEPLSKRGTISLENVIDCYTHWYNEWIPITSSPDDGTPKGCHVASAITPEETSKALLLAIESSLAKTQRSQSQRRIVVVDSLSSILSLSPHLYTVLHLLDSLHINNVQDGKVSNPPVVLAATIRSSELEQSLFEALQKLADIHVLVHQFSSKLKVTPPSHLGEDREFVRIDVRKRKASGRVLFDEHIAKMDWDTIQLREIGSGKGIYEGRDDNKQNSEKGNAPLELAQHGLSFRVTLSSKEREVRAAAGLPYLHRDEELANSALTFHPKNLCLQKSRTDKTEGDSSDSCSIESDGEDMFSEDV